MFNIFKQEYIHPYEKVITLIGVINVNELFVEPNFNVLKHFHPLFEPIVGILGDGNTIYNIEESEQVKKIEK